jgi:hypothetical protein
MTGNLIKNKWGKKLILRQIFQVISQLVAGYWTQQN